ncbi:hypothetical protein V8E36_002290 [Tilletia maclaganii]
MRTTAALVERSAKKKAKAAFYQGLPALLDPPIDREVQRASQIAELKSSSIISDTAELTVNQFDAVLSLAQAHLPLILTLARRRSGNNDTAAQMQTAVVGATSEQEETFDGQTDAAASAQLAVLDSRPAVSVIVAVTLNSRSQRSNQLQAAIGLLLRFQNAPKATQTLLNRVKLSTSRRTTDRHLAEIQKAATRDAVSMLKDPERIHILLFDNVDIYLKSRSNRVSASADIVNLTQRTLLQLPATYKAAHVSVEALRPLDGVRKLAEAELKGDDEFLQRSGRLFLTRELLRAMQNDQQPIRIAQHCFGRRLSHQMQYRASHRRASGGDIAPLPIVEENEGTIEGALAEVEQSARLLGILDCGDDAPGNRDGAPQRGIDAQGVRRADINYQQAILPPDRLFFALGDLKTHRNVEAGLRSRSSHAHPADRMDYFRSLFGPWHLHLNLVWACFSAHFSADKNGHSVSLERVRDALRRGKKALQEDQPSYTEAWNLLQHTFSGWIYLQFERALKKEKKTLSTWKPKDLDAVATLVSKVWDDTFSETSIHTAQLRHDELGSNARLLLRDVLLALEWDDACRLGDVGRLVETEKFLAVFFAGCGKQQYSQACLDDIWAAKVLEPDTARTLLAARFVNRSGARSGFIGGDLYQEHLNKAVQANDVTHGAERAVERLRDVFSGTNEVARAVRRAHSDLLGESGRGRSKHERYQRDIQRISHIASQDAIFDQLQSRFAPVTLQKKAQSPVARKTQTDEKVPTAAELLQGLLSPKYGNDLLEQGVIYRWEALRSPWKRYHSYLAADGIRSSENVGESNLSDAADAYISQAKENDDDGELGLTGEDHRLMPRIDDSHLLLTDEEHDLLERRWREREWDRREEDEGQTDAGPELVTADEEEGSQVPEDE